MRLHRLGQVLSIFCKELPGRDADPLQDGRHMSLKIKACKANRIRQSDRQASAFTGKVNQP
jgi:hypothetical protein